MGEFEEKLNKILSSPQEMEKIMELARSFSGPDEKNESKSTPVSNGHKTENDPASLLSGLDPKLLHIAGKLMGEYSHSSSDKTALLTAIKPYLKKERIETLDKAANIAKLARLAKIALSEFSGGEHDL
jgi:hypothetical protein